MNIHSKRCSKCLTCQPLSEYFKNRGSLMARCKTCHQESIGSKAKWTPNELAVIHALYPDGGAPACYVVLGPKRSIAAINQQACREGVRYEFTGRAGEQKYLAGIKPKGTPLPFQDTAADHRAWQEVDSATRAPMPAVLGWRLAA